MQTHKLAAAYCLALMPAVQAQPLLPPAEPVAFERVWLQAWPEAEPEQTAPLLPVLNTVETPATLEAAIAQAMQMRQWAALGDLLARYAAVPGHNRDVLRYAQGAWLRSQQRHEEAAALYRELLADSPHLAVPKLELGILLLEDRRLRESAAVLQEVRPALPEPLAEAAEAYTQAAARMQDWRFSAGVSYEQTDNVNQAAGETQPLLGGIRFTLSEESRPQPAHGVRYFVQAEQERNVGGRHYLRLAGDAGGIRYWDNTAYSEQSYGVEAGYLNHGVARSWGVVPFYRFNLLGGDAYGRQYGVRAEYERRFAGGHRWSLRATHTRKHYSASRTEAVYGGFSHAVSATFSRVLSPEGAVFAGADVSRDRVSDAAESSWRAGLSVGGTYRTAWLGVRGQVRYGWRRFDENYRLRLWGRWVVDERRRDREYQAGVSVWSPKLVWQGVTPQINYQYRRTGSNISALFSRWHSAWFVSMEKAF
ncbi:MAG: surface lipoprotein assembly modifier [Eikenella sp.]|nr:surface lipoprotein assembly modifier [Eikenella sp.]